MINYSATQYNRSIFFKEAGIVVGVTTIFASMDILFTWIRNLRDYQNYNDLTAGDWKDIGTASGLTSAILIVMLIFKNLCIKTPVRPFAISELAAPIISSIIFFGLELLLKYLTNNHNEKNHLEITRNDLIDSGISSSTLFILLIVVSLFQNYSQHRQSYSIEGEHTILDSGTDPENMATYGTQTIINI